MPVTVKGSGGGGVTLDAGSAASNTTLTLPNTSGTILQSGTAVTAAQGGTGLTSPGSSGNVLTSNGTGWTSAAATTVGGINVQTFTSSAQSPWTKPTGYAAGSRVLIQAWGGGGSGSRAASNANGGGGGGYNERWMTLSDMGATETISIGAGGAARTTTAVGNVGGNTIVGASALVTAYGGGGGDNSGSGGGGGGQLSAGAAFNSGAPYLGSSGNGAINTPCITVAASYSGFMHGGGGGIPFSSPSVKNGAGSVWGGGGGGGGSTATANTGTGGTSSYGGNGGAGSSTTAVAGSQPGGSGGGGAGVNSGAGGDGKVIITVFPA